MAKDINPFSGVLRALLCVCAISFSTVTAAAQSPTFAAQNYQLLGNTHIASDFNGDGKLDLAGSGFIAASVMLNNGDGTFRPKVDYPVAGPTQNVAAGDFNSDGKLDLVVTINTPEISLALLTGNGDGTFNAPVHFPNTSGFDSPSVVAADLNNDGKLDVVIMHSIACYTAPCTAATTISVMLGHGDGTFQPPVRYLVPPPQSSMGAIFITANDLKGDGKPDVALEVSGGGNSLSVLINTTGTQPAPVTISSLSLNPSNVTGGNASTATVTLSVRVQTSTTIRLSSNNAAAKVPSSITVAAGTSSATFAISTTQVSAQTTATITATLNNVSRSASLTINPATSTTDRVSITRAEYESSKRTLRVEATSTRSNATLQVLITSSNQLIGTLTNNGGGKYGGQFILSANPQSITVRSNFGGQATRAVTLK